MPNRYYQQSQSPRRQGDVNPAFDEERFERFRRDEEDRRFEGRTDDTRRFGSNRDNDYRGSDYGGRGDYDRDFDRDNDDRGFDRGYDASDRDQPAANRGFSESDRRPREYGDMATMGARRGYGMGGQGRDFAPFERTGYRMGGSFAVSEAPDVSHRGKGPRGYTRSDARIEEEINDLLTDAHDIDASEITVKVSGGEVTLTGTVQSRDMRYRAEHLIDQIGGVSEIDNQIKVQKAGAATTGKTEGKKAERGSGPHDLAGNNDKNRRMHS